MHDKFYADHGQQRLHASVHHDGVAAQESFIHMRNCHGARLPRLVGIVMSGCYRGASKSHHEILVLVNDLLGELVLVAVPAFISVKPQILLALSSPDVFADVH